MIDCTVHDLIVGNLPHLREGWITFGRRRLLLFIGARITGSLAFAVQLAVGADLLDASFMRMQRCLFMVDCSSREREVCPSWEGGEVGGEGGGGVRGAVWCGGVDAWHSYPVCMRVWAHCMSVSAVACATAYPPYNE